VRIGPPFGKRATYPLSILQSFGQIKIIMKSTCSLQFILLLTLTTSTSLSAPIPDQHEECPNSASCSPPLRSNPRHIQSSGPLHEPHFPAHQQDNTESILLEHLTTRPNSAIPPEPLPRIRKFKAALDVVPSVDSGLRTSRSNIISIKTTHSTGALTAVDLEDLRDVDINTDQSTLAASILEKIRSIAGRPTQKCTKMTPMPSDSNGGITVTYTYSYGYLRRDYTDMMVVSIVLLFLFVIIMIELLGKIIEM
jgi:hypothetical protein